MQFSASLQLLTCLMMCASCAQGIMVKFGTKGGPIEPPAPEPSLPSLQPIRVPAPVWEERSYDTPDPNAQWRLQMFSTQPRYSHVVYKDSTPAPIPFTNAQQFVNAYIPIRQPINAHTVKNYFTPAQVLASHNTPGVGLRYFEPIYANRLRKHLQTRQEDAHHNSLETNKVDVDRHDSASDLQWKFEKDLTKRIARNTQEEAVVPVYPWSSFVLARHL